MYPPPQARFVLFLKYTLMPDVLINDCKNHIQLIHPQIDRSRLFSPYRVRHLFRGSSGAVNKCPAEVFEWVSFYQKGPALAWPGRSFPGGSFARERSLGGRLVKRSRTLSSLWGPPRRVEEEDVRA